MRYKWVKMLSDDGYNILATIKKPMKHPYIMEENLRRVGELEQVEKMFYSVEKNIINTLSYTLNAKGL